jgi:hypothetical protein
MKQLFTFILFATICISGKGQGIGSKVSFLGTDGKTYTGTVNEIQGNRYKIKYDGYDFEAWATAEQLTVLNTVSTTAGSIGSKVSFTAVDGKKYSGTVKAIQGNQYKIAYDGMNFEAWLTAGQFSFVETNTTVLQQAPKTQYTPAQNGSLQDLRNIFDFGRAKGWASLVHENKFQLFTQNLAAQDIKNLVGFFNQAKTASAKFFALKSWLTGDYIPELQTFMDEMNTVSEIVQQEKCLVNTHLSIIQQWQQTCSVAVVQTYLGDLCPRYVWGLKKIQDYNVLDHDSKSATAQQQRWLLEKYGGTVSVRGDNTGKQIPINDPLNDYVGKILGLHFSTQQVTTSIPEVFTKVRSEVDKGLDVPLLIGFVGTDARHFILVMKYRYVQGQFQYLIYDPWDGLCDYVNENTIQQGSMSPLFPNNRISVDYYYTAD